MYDNNLAHVIAEQNEEEPLTDFEKINPYTDLENLNLNWREKDLPERLRTKHVHRLHPYMGKFIPQLVEIFLRKFRPDFVYDPFCGSGTTLVEANSLGIDSIGTDISAFNVLLSKVKTDTYNIELLTKELSDILAKTSECEDELFSDARSLFYRKNGRETDNVTGNDYINEWFASQARKELLSYLSLIENYQYQDLLKVILSRSARSARLVKHYDLDFPKEPQKEPYECYKHRRICTPVQEARKFLVRYTRDALKRIAEFNRIKSNAQVEVIHGDSRNVKLPKGIDMVFTSPPYIGLIDYHEQHRYAYELLGLVNNEIKEIGPAKNGSSDRAKREYIQEINGVLLHTRDHMAEKGIMAIVVNDKHDLYDPSKVGFRTIGRVERHVNRRTGRRNGAFYESILIWEKS